MRVYRQSPHGGKVVRGGCDALRRVFNKERGVFDAARGVFDAVRGVCDAARGVCGVYDCDPVVPYLLEMINERLQPGTGRLRNVIR